MERITDVLKLHFNSFEEHLITKEEAIEGILEHLKERFKEVGDEL